jgi:predicted nicotinamide N-methyase
VNARRSPDVDFVRSRTRLTTSPLVPEIRLHLAGEAFGLWEDAQDQAGPEAPLPFWAFAWAGGLALARYVLDHAEVVKGRRVWDLAAGSGLIAIAAALAGAVRVVASDTDPLALAAIGLNAAVNGVSIVTIAEDARHGTPRDTDVVLAGDVFYDAGVARDALAFLGRARACGARVLVGDPGRAHLPRWRFTPLATYEVRGAGAVEGADVVAATVWQPAEA